jgi:hypothetical protein
MTGDNRIYEVAIDVPLLMNGSDILLYLAQTPPPSAEEIFQRKAAPELMPFLETLLRRNEATGEPSRLEAMAPSPSDTALVLIPECAITMANWERVDELVRGLTRTAIVIAGLGYASSAELKEWRKAQPDTESSTRRIFGFKERAGIGTPNMFFNTACSWIHHGDGRTSCVISLKNFLEQREEALKEKGLEEGSELLCLSAPDLVIYPLICAEFTCTREGDRPLDRVARDIPGRVGGRKVLVAGLAYQHNEVHPLWQRGIYAATGAARGIPVVAAIVNNALWFSHPDEMKDKWRCLTGVYVDRSHLLSQEALPPVRCLADDNTVFGVLARTNLPGVFTGKLSWDFGRGGTRFVWRATRRALASTDGSLLEADLGDAYLDELYRSIRRFYPSHTASASEDEKQKSRNGEAALTEVDNHLNSHDQPDAKRLATTLFHGLRADLEREEVDPDTLFMNHGHLMRGLRAIGALKGRESTCWQPDVTQEGQLIDVARRVNILVWSDPDHGCMAISRTIERWARDFPGKRPLLILAEGNSGEFENEGMVKASQRGNITSPRDTGDTYSRNITSSRESAITNPRDICNKAYILRMGRIENHLEEPDFIAALERELEQPLRELAQRSGEA